MRWLTVFNFRRHAVLDRRSSMGKTAMSKCSGLNERMHRVLESVEELSWLDGEFTRRRPDKQTALVSDKKE